MVQWVVGSILHGGSISHSSQYTTTGVTKAVVCVILSVRYAYKRTIAANWKVTRGSSGFPRYVSGPLPNV